MRIIAISLVFWLAVWCRADASSRNARAGGIDYDHTEKYLVGGPQTTLTREDWAMIQPHLQFTQVDLEALGKLYAWKRAWFKSEAGGGKFVGRHSVQDLIRQRTLTGCHDHGLIVAAILRHCGVPAVMVDATSIDWALQYPETTKAFRGHVFVEMFLQNAWMLLDSVTGEYLSGYDPLNPLIPLPKPEDPRGFYAMFKGLDPAGYGITRIEDLNAAQVHFAQLIRSEIANFLYPQSPIRRLPGAAK